MVPIFPMVTTSDPKQLRKMEARANEGDHENESVEIIAPPPSAWVLNETDLPLQKSPVKESIEILPKEEEEETKNISNNQHQQQQPPPPHPIRKRTSFWDIFKASIHQKGDEQQQHSSENVQEGDKFVAGLEAKLVELSDNKDEKHQIEQQSEQQNESKPESDNSLSKQSSRESENATQTENNVIRPKLRRQTSVMSFALNMGWTKRARRLTDSTGYSTSSNAFPSSGIASRSSTFDSTQASNEVIINPSTLCHLDDKNGHQIAEDCVKFAHARHTIKTTKEIEILRKLATELENSFRHQIDKVAILHSQLESVHWRQHDLQDENIHLRSQIGSLSEQIVNQQAQIEALRVTVKSLSLTLSPHQTEENNNDNHDDNEHDKKEEHNSILQHYQDNEDSSHESTEASTPHIPPAESPKAIESDIKLHDKDEIKVLQNEHSEAKEDDPVLFSAGILSANPNQSFMHVSA